MSNSSLFDLRDHSSTDLDRLEMAINSGIKEAQNLKLVETVETLIAFRNLTNCCKRLAIERESDEWAAKNAKEIAEGKF